MEVYRLLFRDRPGDTNSMTVTSCWYQQQQLLFIERSVRRYSPRLHTAYKLWWTTCLPVSRPVDALQAGAEIADDDLLIDALLSNACPYAIVGYRRLLCCCCCCC